MSNAKGGRILQGSLVFFIEVNTFVIVIIQSNYSSLWRE